MNRWDKAVEDLGQLNSLFSQVDKKPTDEKVLRKCLNKVNKVTGLSVWAMKCLAPEDYQKLLDPRRRASKLGKDASPEEISPVLNDFRAELQRCLDTTAPESFSYSGFKVSNPEHLSDELCRKTLEGVDFLSGLFKKRGVPDLLSQGISKVVLELDAGAAGLYHSGTRELTLSVGVLSSGNAGRILDQRVNETILHEFGHYVHRNYITGEARDAWEEPWGNLPSLANPHALQVPEGVRKNQLDPLDIVTEYGKVDKYEDFADTFMVFMAAPEKLTPTAKYRMQRALSLSGLYGKPVIRLASRIVSRWLASSPPNGR